ncbi:MAG: rhodanese-like domain-containing protein [Deltaproteobacteria bacterium]|nr:rhodanese-like domain-containing protein [Deltaproteobacteria bacterium]
MAMQGTGEAQVNLAQELRRALGHAVLITLGASCLGLVVNLFHPEGIPYVTWSDYETLVPCPVPGGKVSGIGARDPLLVDARSLLVDARPKKDYQAWTMKQALNAPFDYLDPMPESVLKDMTRKIAASRAVRVIVFGDGDKPDSGEQLARELSGRGIKHVMFVEGGAPALMRAVNAGGKPAIRNKAR